jgi:hypothetical protein
MSIPVVRVHCRDQIYSPYSGQPADGKDGPNKKDPTLLFVYYGNPGIYAYSSQRLRNLMNEDIEYLDAEAIHTHIDIDGGLIMEVMTDVNGVNYYGFAPAD